MQKSLLMSRSTISNPFDYVAPLSIREKSGLAALMNASHMSMEMLCRALKSAIPCVLSQVPSVSRLAILKDVEHHVGILVQNDGRILVPLLE